MFGKKKTSPEKTEETAVKDFFDMIVPCASLRRFH